MNLSTFITRVIVTAIGLCVSLLSVAQTEQPVASDAATAMPHQGAYMVQVLLGLVFVLSLVFACAWLVKRLGQGTLVGSAQMKVLATLPMGTRERIALIEVGQQQLLLGVTATSINTLHVFDEPVISPIADGADKDFASKLREILAKGTIKP